MEYYEISNLYACGFEASITINDLSFTLMGTIQAGLGYLTILRKGRFLTFCKATEYSPFALGLLEVSIPC